MNDLSAIHDLFPDFVGNIHHLGALESQSAIDRLVNHEFGQRGRLCRAVVFSIATTGSAGAVAGRRKTTEHRFFRIEIERHGRAAVFHAPQRRRFDHAGVRMP